MLLPRWFLLLNGAGLLCLALTMLLLKLREEGSLASTRKVLGLFWSLLCLAVAAALLLMAAGRLPQPGERPAREAPRHAPIFPTDR